MPAIREAGARGRSTHEKNKRVLMKSEIQPIANRPHNYRLDYFSLRVGRSVGRSVCWKNNTDGDKYIPTAKIKHKGFRIQQR